MPFPILRHLYKIEAFVAFLKLMMSFFFFSVCYAALEGEVNNKDKYEM